MHHSFLGAKVDFRFISIVFCSPALYHIFYLMALSLGLSFRFILHPGSGLFWLLCQQSQDSSLQRHCRAFMERSQSPAPGRPLCWAPFQAAEIPASSSLTAFVFHRSLRLNWRAPSTWESSAMKTVTTKACSTRTTTRSWTRSWAKAKSR